MTVAALDLAAAAFAVVGYYEPWWIQILKALIIFFVVLQLLPMYIITERKLLGRLQHRYGPNRVGPFGSFQPMADIVKFIGKEASRPTTAVGFVFTIAPIIGIMAAVAAAAVIPFGDTVDILGTEVGLYGVDSSIGVLYAFAFGAMAFYALVLGGWASGSKYSLLGAMRAAAQLISYEVAQGLAIVGVIMTAGTLSLTEIVHSQADGTWFIIPQFVGFMTFLIAGFAETNRAPFDMPEADAELVQGYMTEYGGTRMVAFLFAEYLNMVIVSALTVTLFLGGWLLPFGLDAPGWAHPLIVIGKITALVLFFIWVRGTLPRLRYDQLMSFGWKILLPVATLNALVTAVILILVD